MLNAALRSRRAPQNIYQSLLFMMKAFFASMESPTNKSYRNLGVERADEQNRMVMKGPSALEWCAKSKEGIIGPWFLENENITIESYRNVQMFYASRRFRSLGENYIFSERQCCSTILGHNYRLFKQTRSKLLD